MKNKCDVCHNISTGVEKPTSCFLDHIRLYSAFKINYLFKMTIFS